MSDDVKEALYRYRFGSAEFDEARFELRVSGLPVDVQRKPLELLSVLLAHTGEVVSRDELLDTVWQGRPTVDNVVANAIAKLRGALGPEGAAHILTQPRVGYRFTGPLERTAVGRSPTSQLQLADGMAVPSRPNFTLRSQLGSSRESEVWIARHGKTGEQRVYKFCPGGEQLAALKREATLYRVLRENLGERPDFARIIDWNFESTPFFLECEYAGQALGEWSQGEDGFAAMGLDQRLDLFLRIADAVAAAHSVGVLHKDIKPSNVLVKAAPDTGWQPCLNDFGSGRLLESGRLGDITGLGLTREVLSDAGRGTAQYLAPELLAGQAPTVQSDLYALGILLYQFLVGDLRKPMAPGWERDVADSLLRQDLAATTDGDPARRLTGVPELSQRLRQLELRRREQLRLAAAERSAQDARLALQRSRARRPWLLATLLALCAGLGTSLWLYRAAGLANDRLQAVNNFLYRDVLANTGALKTDSDPDPSLRRVLRNAADIAGERFAGDPGNEGWIRYGVGQGLSGLGDYQHAEQQQRLAVDLLSRAHGPADPRSLQARRGLAMLLLEQSRFDEAEAALSAVDLLQEDSDIAPDDAFVLQALRGMLRAARKDCTSALTDLQSAAGIALPPSAETTYNRFNVGSWIGETLNCLERYDDALLHYQTLLAGDPDAAMLGPALIAYARLGQATALLHLGQSRSAEQILLAALHSLESSIGHTDAFTMGQALVVAGRFYVDLGELNHATGYLERGRGLLLGVDARQEKALSALRLLGTVDYCQGNIERATERLGAARSAFAESYGADSPDAQGAGFWLAAALLRAGEPEAAGQLLAALDPAALAIGLGSADWDNRLAALRSQIPARPDGSPPARQTAAFEFCPPVAGGTP
ncbi:MAG: protein kinase domain-containing protein [Parahaliea sp.]